MDVTPANDLRTKAGFTPVSGAIGAAGEVASSLKFSLPFSSTGRALAQTELFARGGP